MSSTHASRHDEDTHRGHEHPHPVRADVEDQPHTHHMALTEAVLDLLSAKGIIEAGELRRTLETIDGATPEAGARLVARAWTDPTFRERLLADTNAAARELGFDPGNIPIETLADTPDRHNLIVCTLCSCYPRFLLGSPPDWYKQRAYRSRAVREPRAVLAEFGVQLPAAVAVDVHDSTAERRYLVLPLQPAGTEGWPEDRLAGLVTRDCLIGVALPTVE
jgi:nitrile hydratase